MPTAIPSAKQVRASAQAIIDAIQPPSIPDRDLDLIAHAGVEPDPEGSHDFGPAIASAIAQLSAAGGGRLVFRHPAGAHAWVKPVLTYRVLGPIHLRSRISLEFDPCLRLFFPFAPRAFTVGGDGVYLRYEGSSIFSFSPLIYAFDCADIRLRARPGSGAPPVIDGDGERWQTWADLGQRAQEKTGRKPSYQRLKEINQSRVALAARRFVDPDADFFRPTLLGLYFSRRIEVEGLRLQNSPFWVVHPVFCQHAVFRGLLFHAYVVNNDGIDPESSSHVLIENVIFGNHDDNVAVKGGRDVEGREGIPVTDTPLAALRHPAIHEGRLGAPTENIVVRHCCFEGHYGFCVGSDLANTTRHIYALDNVVTREVGMAVYVKNSRSRGACIHDVHVLGLEVAASRGPVVCVNANYDNDSHSAHPPSISRISVREVRARQAGGGVTINGWSDAPIRDLLVEDLSVAALLAANSQSPAAPFALQNAVGVTLRRCVAGGVSIDGEALEARSAEPPPHVT